MIKKIITKQDELNAAVVNEWRTNPSVKFHLAIYAEMGELLDSHPFEWWKKTYFKQIDLLNIRIELIDIFHFYLSLSMKLIGDDKTQEIIEEITEEKISSGNLEYDFERYLEDFMLSVGKIVETTRVPVFGAEGIALKYQRLHNIISIGFINLFEAFYQTGMESEDDIFNLYILKNSLNLVRKENGYKEGTYMKLWTKNENMISEPQSFKIEDNHFIMQEMENFYAENKNDSDVFLLAKKEIQKLYDKQEGKI